MFVLSLLLCPIGATVVFFLLKKKQEWVKRGNQLYPPRIFLRLIR